MLNGFSVDVEDWYHILNTHKAPLEKDWDSLESRVGRNVDIILDLMDQYNVKGTFFWLGWLAERNKPTLLRCVKAGHEIASHGYSHVLPSQVGREKFQEDVSKAKKVLEDISGKRVKGFRVAGFGIDQETLWVFDVLKQAGYKYDSSVFPLWITRDGNPRKMAANCQCPYVIQTHYGPLIEIPMPAVHMLGVRLFFFGGGYLRLTPINLINWGINKLNNKDAPAIVYMHPREIDPDQPRLPLSVMRSFKYYVNIKNTVAKLRFLFENFNFAPLVKLVHINDKETVMFMNDKIQ